MLTPGSIGPVSRVTPHMVRNNSMTCGDGPKVGSQCHRLWACGRVARRVSGRWEYPATLSQTLVFFSLKWSGKFSKSVQMLQWTEGLCVASSLSAQAHIEVVKFVLPIVGLNLDWIENLFVFYLVYKKVKNFCE
jgi:hypothetical protein